MIPPVLDDDDDDDDNDDDDDERVKNNDDPPQYSISQRLFGEAVLGLSQVQPVTHQAFSYHQSCVMHVRICMS